MAKALDSKSGDLSSNPSPSFNLGFFPQIIGNYPLLPNPFPEAVLFLIILSIMITTTNNNLFTIIG